MGKEDMNPKPEPSEGSLDGLRVVDLSRVLAGPLCTQILADHGAEVIKFEPPQGDETRHWGPPFLDDGMSAYFGGINRNKRNISVDLRVEAGQQILRAVLEDADILVENFKAHTLEKWGFSDDYIRETYPQLIHCRITGFGTDGPMGGMPGYDAVVQAYSGLMSVNGEPEGAALRVGVPIVDMVTGIYAFSGILLALHSRNTTGKGQLVDCTLVDTAVSILHPHSPAHLADGRVPQRTGSAHPTIAPYDTFEAKDGPIFIGAGNDRQFSHLATLLELPDLLTDDRFRSNSDRVINSGALKPILESRVRGMKRRELAKRLLAVGVPASAVHNIAEALADPHVRHRHMVAEVGDYRTTGVPIKLSDTPGSVRTAPQARGTETREVLRSVGYGEEEIAFLAESNVVSYGA